MLLFHSFDLWSVSVATNPLSVPWTLEEDWISLYNLICVPFDPSKYRVICSRPSLILESLVYNRRHRTETGVNRRIGVPMGVPR